MKKIDLEYLAFLEGRKLANPLKLPKGADVFFRSNKSHLKALCIFFELKPLFYDGRFKAGFHKKNTIAKYLNMSRSSFNKKLDQLIKLEIVKQEKFDLVLCSWKRLFEIFNFPIKSTKPHRFNYSKNLYSNSEFIIRYFSIKENFERQKFAIERKLYTQKYKTDQEFILMSQIKELNHDNQITVLDKLRLVNGLILKLNHLNIGQIKMKKALLSQLYIDGCRNYFKEQKEFNYLHPINFDISISCQGLANLFGCKWASSGHYWQSMLLKAGFLSVQKRVVYLPNVSTFRFQHEQVMGDLNYHYYQGKEKGVFRRLNNLLTLHQISN